MRAVMFILAILCPESDLAWAATECAQPSPIVHIENLACSDSGGEKYCIINTKILIARIFIRMMRRANGIAEIFMVWMMIK